MTNTNTDVYPANYVRPFDKVRLLVAIERAGFWPGPETPALDAVIADGYVKATGHDAFEYVLTEKGMDHLEGFRRLLEPAED